MSKLCSENDCCQSFPNGQFKLPLKKKQASAISINKQLTLVDLKLDQMGSDKSLSLSTVFVQLKVSQSVKTKAVLSVAFLFSYFLISHLSH